MYKQLRLSLLATAFVAFSQASPAFSQRVVDNPIAYRVAAPNQRLEMIVNTSRILVFDHAIPRLMVNNPSLIRATPLSESEIQLSALTPGVTQVNLWDENKKVYVVDVIVTADARELQELLRTEFPTASIRVRPLASSIVLSGYVATSQDVGRVVRMSQDYYPQVINNLSVGGVQQVLLHVKIMEVSRTKFRNMGFDFGAISGNDFAVSSVSGMINMAATSVQIATQKRTALLGPNVVQASGDTVRFGIINNNSGFLGFLQFLRRNNLSKILAEPTLVTVSGRPASFNVGGSFPITVPQSLGTVSIEYRQFGTRVDFVPIVMGNGRIRLEVRPQVTERDDANGINGVPAIKERWVDTAVEMNAGQTLALAGLISRRTETVNSGIPYLADLPWIGAAFRRVQETENEVELLIIVRPEFVDAMDPHEVPRLGPGENSASPNDEDLYFRGYMEVPKCDNGSLPPGQGAFGPGPSPQFYEEVQPQLELRSGANTPPAPAIPPPAPASKPPAKATGQIRSSSGLRQPVSLIAPKALRTSRLPATAQHTLQNPNSRTYQKPQSSSQEVGASPGLIGPLGYDVLRFKK